MATNGSGPRSCSNCGRRMVLRVARRGARAGSKFWGCTGFPDCRETRPYADPAADAAIESRIGHQSGAAINGKRPGNAGGASGATKSRRGQETSLFDPGVTWTDATLQRPGWVVRYDSVGGTLRATGGHGAIGHRLDQCYLARTESSQRPTPGAYQVSGLLRNVIQRGRHSPLHPEAESVVLEAAGLSNFVELTGLPGDLAMTLSAAGRAKTSHMRDQVQQVDIGAKLKVDSNLTFGSDEELEFLTGWLPQISDWAARWSAPQAPFGALLGFPSGRIHEARRADFFVPTPDGSGFIVEIDGIQHQGSIASDRERDELLSSADFEVLRIPAGDIRNPERPGIKRLKEVFSKSLSPGNDVLSGLSVLHRGPIEVHRAVLAICDAMANGLLGQDRWEIQIEGCSSWLPEAIAPYMNLLLGFDRIWQLAGSPEVICLRSTGVRLALRRTENGYEVDPSIKFGEPAIRIRFEPDRGPCEVLPKLDATAQIVIRDARLPVEFAASDIMIESIPNPPNPSLAELTWGLRQVLKAVFAKSDFRPDQLEPLVEVLSGRDCAVLLPTGAGKSLIYQLAGICLAGPVLVIDPLVALIEDQAQGLRDHGFDRLAEISRFTSMRGLTAQAIGDLAAARLQFVFVAPERLQSPGFRSALRTLSHSGTPVALAVIDEAHCVSEWGHDFRPAYLGLGRVVREFCRGPSGRPPALLALTGTASRVVLKDLVRELEIAPTSENSIVRPTSFDRAELNFQVINAAPDEAEAALIGAIKAMPRKFRVAEREFFTPRGNRTYSGIVFCPHVNGRHGILNVAEAIGPTIGGPVVFYSGGAPKDWDGEEWENRKRSNAQHFKGNQVPVLVATKSYGMGIDKPNVRFVVHYGLPSSIESFYQEVGRAGRDQKDAHCTLVLIENDERRARTLLSADARLEQVRRINADVGYYDADDVTRQLFFHLNSFAGVESDIADVKSLIGEVGEVGRPRTAEVPFGLRSRVGRERSIHRLVLLGLVANYAVEWGSQRFTLRLTDCDAPEIVERFIEYVRQIQPARAEKASDDSAELASSDLTAAALGCARLLIEFAYEFIEGSRRRSLREMWLAARESVPDPNRMLRSRILDYLMEGDVSHALEQMVESEQFNFSVWTGYLDELQGSGELLDLRGSTGRLLSSYPDHPGLLLARAIAEVVGPVGDLREFQYNLQASLESSRLNYGSDADATLELIDWLFERSLDWRTGSCTAAYIAVSNALRGSPHSAKVRELVLCSGEADLGSRVLALGEALDDSAKRLEEAVALTARILE